MDEARFLSTITSISRSSRNVVNSGVVKSILGGAKPTDIIRNELTKKLLGGVKHLVSGKIDFSFLEKIRNAAKPLDPAKQLGSVKAEVSNIQSSLPSPSNPDFSAVRIHEQGTGRYVNFNVTPDVSESKNTNYVEISELRKAASMMIFIGSPSRSFNINAKLVSRTKQEASENFARLQLLKSWAMPDNTSKSVGITGGAIDQSAPPVLYIYGYGKNFKAIQVVMKSINISFDSGVDYISTNDTKTKMPIILPVSMSFQEIRSAVDLNNFDIEAYRKGTLDYW